MADNTTGRRSYRSDEDSRGGSGASKAAGETGGRDPLAELARLIGQDDPFHEPKQARSGGLYTHLGKRGEFGNLNLNLAQYGSLVTTVFPMLPPLR